MQTKSDKLGAGILINAFVMPGAGHVAAGMKGRGFAIAAGAVALVCYPAFRFAAALSGALREIPVEAGALARSVHAVSMAWGKERNWILACALALLVLWVFGVVDLYVRRRRLGVGSKERA